MCGTSIWYGHVTFPQGQTTGHHASALPYRSPKVVPVSTTEPRITSATARTPVITWVLMALALITALLLLDWNDTGIPKPLWFMLLPSLLGFAGTGFALHARKGGWALLSGVWGVAMVPALFVAVTLISGP